MEVGVYVLVYPPNSNYRKYELEYEVLSMSGCWIHTKCDVDSLKKNSHISNSKKTKTKRKCLMILKRLLKII